MARDVESVLIWLTDTPGAKPLPAAKEFGEKVRGMLSARFGSWLRLAEHDNQWATKTNVLASLKSAISNLRERPEGLLVLAFSGHGNKLPEDRLEWVLHSGTSTSTAQDTLTEDELSRELEELPAGLEVVLVLDCCYAERGLPNSILRKWLWRLLPSLALTQLNIATDAMVERLSRPATDGKARNVIGIVSTNLVLGRRNSPDNYFARCLHQVVVSSLAARYEQVDEEMIKLREHMAVTVVQESWRVVFKPDAAGKLPPFLQ